MRCIFVDYRFTQPLAGREFGIRNFYMRVNEFNKMIKTM